MRLKTPGNALFETLCSLPVRTTAFRFDKSWNYVPSTNFEVIMENNSDCCKEQKVLSDTNHRIVKNKENSLRFKFVRIFSSGTLKSPKSPLSISSSQCSSPSYDSPRMKARYSWDLSSLSKEYSTLRALEDDTSSKSAINTSPTNSPTSSSSPHSPYSTCYINER